MHLLFDVAGPANDQVASLDSTLFVRDPFPVVSAADMLNRTTDRNTRVIVFVRNLQLAQGEAASSVIVNLIDSFGQNYDVPAESVRPVANADFVQVIFRLPDNLAAGTGKVTIKAHGQVSNSGTFRIRI
jgi:hypothetical protein